MINPGLFFLFILLIYPGYLALLVINTLITKVKNKDSFWDITYHSIIHSLFVYMFIFSFWYPNAYSCGLNVFNEPEIIKYVTKDAWMPLKIVGVVTGSSIFYGILYGLSYRFELLTKFLKLFTKKIAEPPNILADLIDTKYGAAPAGHWLTFKLGDKMYSGSIKTAKLDQEPREFLIENVQILNEETHEPMLAYPPGERIWIKVDDNVTILTIKSVFKPIKEKPLKVIILSYTMTLIEKIKFAIRLVFYP